MAFSGLGCDATGPDPNAITIVEDETYPITVLHAAQSGSGPTIVMDGEHTSTGFWDKDVTLKRPPTAINLVLSAEDDESGIWKLEIWVTVDTKVCEGVAGLPLSCTSSSVTNGYGSPRFQAKEPQLSPGDVDSKIEVLVAALDNVAPRAPQSPGSTASATIDISGVAYNHWLSEVSPYRTGSIIYHWSESR
jgi:hypothetical protein